MHYSSFIIPIAIAFTFCECTEPSLNEQRENDCDTPVGAQSLECKEQFQMECAVTDFGASYAIAQTDGSNWLFRSEAANSNRLLRIDLLSNWGGPTGPGTYPLDGINYQDCGLCVLAFSDCSSGACARVLYADEGSVEITQLGTKAGGRMSGIFHNVRLKEVLIGNDWSSTLVQGGQTWCLDGFTFDQELFNPNGIDLSEEDIPEATEAQCLPQGNGNGIGANIPDFELTNCLGDVVSLHSLGCNNDARAIWVVASADWCSPCHDYADRARQRLDIDGPNGLVLVEVIGEDATGGAPTEDTCKRYAQQHGLPLETTFIDPHWTTLWEHIFLYPYSGGTMSLPWVAILNGPNMAYVYNSQLNSGVTDSAVLDELLAQDPPDSPSQD